jgi:transposase
VTVPDRYDPDINTTLLELASHYDTVVIPARPRKPRDKAKVETGVLIVQRWILERLRHRRVFHLEELSDAVGERIDAQEARPLYPR